MSMRFNQGKCCEREGKNGASVARHVTEKHARIEEARSSCNFCPHRVVSVFRNRFFLNSILKRKEVRKYEKHERMKESAERDPGRE